MFSDLNKLIQVAEASVPISELHLNSIKDITSILTKVKEAKDATTKLKSLCQPLKTIPFVSQLPLVKEVLANIDFLDSILKSINL